MAYLFGDLPRHAGRSYLDRYWGRYCAGHSLSGSGATLPVNDHQSDLPCRWRVKLQRVKLLADAGNGVNYRRAMKFLSER